MKLTHNLPLSISLFGKAPEVVQTRLTIDIQAIGERLGGKALYSSRKKASVLSGALRCEILPAKDVESVGDTQAIAATLDDARWLILEGMKGQISGGGCWELLSRLEIAAKKLRGEL